MLFELLEEPYVVLEHMPDVVDIEKHRSHSFETETESEARIDLRVNSNSFQHIRMDHSGTAQFDPPRTLTWTAPIAV